MLCRYATVSHINKGYNDQILLPLLYIVKIPNKIITRQQVYGLLSHTIYIPTGIQTPMTDPRNMRSTMPAFGNFSNKKGPQGVQEEIISERDEEEHIPASNQGQRRRKIQRNTRDDDEIRIVQRSHQPPTQSQNFGASVQTGATQQELIHQRPSTRYENQQSPSQDNSPARQTRNQGLMRKSTIQLSGSKAIGERIISEEYKMAKFQKALDHFQANAYRHRDLANGGQLQKYGVFCENSQLKKFGLGIYFYLELIKHLICYFLLASILEGILMAYNYSGTGLTGYPSSYSLTLVKTTLGNNDIDTEEQVFIQTIIDSLLALCFVIFTLYYRSFSSQAITQFQQSIHELDPEKYITIFSHLKRGDLDTEEVKRFVARKFPVYEVSVVYDYDRRFPALVDMEDLRQKIEQQRLTLKQKGGDSKELQQMETEFQQKQHKLHEENLSRFPMYLIVHFQKISDRLAYEGVFKNRYLTDTIGGAMLRCLACPTQLPEDMRFRGEDQWLLADVKLSKPEDIMWQNMDVNTCRWVLLRILGVFLIIVCLFVTSSLIALSTIYIATSSNCGNYVTITYQQALTASQSTLYCYCQSQIYAGLTDKDVKALCESLTTQIVYNNVLQVAAALVSTVTNILLSIFIRSIVLMMKPKSKSTMYMNIFVANFFAVLLNSVVLPLLLNASIFGTKPVMYISFLSFLDLTNLSLYGDFDKSWYVYVAPYYINMLVVSIILPVVDLLKLSILTPISHCFLRKKQNEILQKEMNRDITSFEFDLPIKLSTLLVYMCLVLMYCSSVPILCPLFLLSMFTTYLCDKKIILTFSKRVSANEQINAVFVKFFPFIFVFHAAFSIWTYTNPSIFSQQNFQKIKLPFFSLGGNFSRATQVSYLLALLAVGIIYLLFDYFIVPFFSCLCACRQSSTVAMQPNQKTFSQRMQKQTLVGSYRMVMNPKYKVLSEYIEELFKLKHLDHTMTAEGLRPGETSAAKLNDSRMELTHH